MSRPCPLCASPEKVLLHEQRFHNKAVSLMEGYDVVACRNCGLAYADGIPSQQEFNEYYAVMSKYEFNDRDGAISEDQVRQFAKLVDFLTPHLPNKDALIVDIGCSTGGLLAELKSRGYRNLHGIDPSPSCAEMVKRLHGIEATAATIDSFRSDRPIDVVILSAVLEHVVDFGSSMRAIRSLLSDNGMLLIEVPDAERFYAHISAPFQQFSIEHINYFTPRSMRNLLATFGFDVVDLRQEVNVFHSVTDPDVYVLARKRQSGDGEIVRDDVGESRLRQYIAECSKIDIEVRRLLADKLTNKGKIIVWGAGTHTQRLLGCGLDPAQIAYFVDSNARYAGKKLQGVDIRSPAEIRDDFPILISTYSYQEEIAAQIRNTLQLSNEIITIY